MSELILLLIKMICPLYSLSCCRSNSFFCCCTAFLISREGNEETCGISPVFMVYFFYLFDTEFTHCNGMITVIRKNDAGRMDFVRKNRKEKEQEDSMYKILVVDDEPKIREVIREYAEFSGYEVTEAEDGMSAVGLCKLNDYDLIIMDIMMPKLDGYSACKEIKKIKDVPIIMLSARGEEYDKLFGFELGIDDYVVKPFSPKELMARVNAVLSRRNSSAKPAQDVLKFKGLEINIAARTVTVDGKKVDLTPKEYELLFYLVQNRNIALSRDKLLSDIWGYDFFGDDRTIDTHIKNLRNNLGPYRDFIVTLRGVGYKFEFED